jgi:hypothetical protein
MKTVTKKIEKVELIKIEKTYNSGKKPTYYYNIYLEGFEFPLMMNTVGETLPNDFAGKKLKYKLNDENEVSEFDIV